MEGSSPFLKKRTKKLLFIGLGPLLWLVAEAGAAGQGIALPVITLRVEQPAYTGMPIWLHLMARDECLERANPTYPWYEYLWLRDDGAEVTKVGQPVAHTPFTDVDTQHLLRIPGLVACYDGKIVGPEHDHYFALSGAYIFDQPGQYRVRWTTQSDHFGRRMDADQSGWFDFTVQPSTAAQREAWLTKMVPSGLQMPDLGPNTNIVTDYIPALVVAWRAPRVTKKLLDLACSDMKDVGIAAAEGLHYDFTPQDAVYFADKVAGGCHWRDSSMAHFLLRHARELSGVRTALLHGLAAHFDKEHPDGAELEDAISAMAVVRCSVPASAADADANAWADADIVRVSRLLLSPHDSDGMNYTQSAFGGLTDYLSHDHLSPAEHALLLEMAAQPALGLAPFEQLIALKDPADLEALGRILANLQGMVWGNYMTDMDTIVQTFGRRSIPMLRIVAQGAKDFMVRDKAAFALMAMGQADGQNVIARSMQSTYWVERRSAARGLDHLVERHVPLGTLAHYCAGVAPGDPCGASQIMTPPGKCEPHFACRVVPKTTAH